LLCRLLSRPAGVIFIDDDRGEGVVKLRTAK
jgi:hypothetical protein